MLIFEAGLYQVLGPMHPTGPLNIKWGFAIHGLSMHVWQWRPEVPTCLVRFYLHGSKDEKNFIQFGRSASLASLDLQGAEEVIWQKPIILVGPFKVLKLVLARTPPGVAVVQGEAVRRWCEQLHHHCRMPRIEEGAPRMIQMQELPGSLLDQEPPFLYKTYPSS